MEVASADLIEKPVDSQARNIDGPQTAKRVMNIKQAIDGKTQLIGLIGWPVSHSFSPAMHNAAAAALGMNWVYLPLPVRSDDVESALSGLSALGFHGVNVTVPHKQAVIPFLDIIEDGARVIGAVNTILINLDPVENGDTWQLTGYNTDWLGFLADLETLKVDVNRRDCLVLGAGGSARAIVYGLAQAGARVHVLARRLTQATQLATDFNDICRVQAGSLSDLADYVADLQAPLVVNTTPLGMTPNIDRSIWPDHLPFPAGAFVYDLVYNPIETRFMQQARASGRGTSNGLGMLIHQGAIAFELWTGQKPDIQIMKQTIGVPHQ
jgi:shikimate dehydrogenase